MVNFKRGEDGDWRRQDRSPTGRRWTETEGSEFRRACLPHPSSWRSDLINSRRGISVSLLRLASLVWLSLTVTVSPHRMHISVCMVVDQTWTVKFYPLLRCDCDAIRFHRLRFAWLQKQPDWMAGYARSGTHKPGRLDTIELSVSASATKITCFAVTRITYVFRVYTDK